jgi:hypothetical protein
MALTAIPAQAPRAGARTRTAHPPRNAGEPVARAFALAVAPLLMLGHYAAWAQETPIAEARLTWYGVYQAGRDAIVKDDSALHGARIVSTGIEPPKINSDRIPARLHSRFGFGFVLSGAPPDGIFRLRYVRNFPADGMTDAKTGERHFSEESELDIRADEKDMFVGYSFDEADELVPGLWSFEVWDGDRKLFEKSFTVYKP